MPRDNRTLPLFKCAFRLGYALSTVRVYPTGHGSTFEVTNEDFGPYLHFFTKRSSTKLAQRCSEAL
jgi:hypothetical protein